jgi:hypothetical protein
VHDRQSFVGQKHPGKEEFISWLNNTALPALWKCAAAVRPDLKEVFTFGDAGFVLKATPKASYGYMYIGAGAISDPTVSEEVSQ